MTSNPNRNAEDPYPATQDNQSINKTHAEWIADGYKPGQRLPNNGWLSWTMDDVDQNDRTKFVAEYVPSLLDPSASVGQKNPIMKVDVNGIVQYITANIENDIPTYFYHPYKNALDLHNSNETFKKHGPEVAMWMQGGYDRQNTWIHMSSAMSFGMDSEGRAIRYGDKYYNEIDGVKFIIKNEKLIGQLYFDGYLDIAITPFQAASIVLKAYKDKLIKKLLRRK